MAFQDRDRFEWQCSTREPAGPGQRRSPVGSRERRGSSATAGLRAGVWILFAVLFATPLQANDSALRGAADSALRAAGEVDALLQQHFTTAGVEPAPLANDEDFYRRIALDLLGRIPDSDALILFTLDPDPEKRARAAREMLHTTTSARYWARYWSDVIFSRATEQRARLAQPAFEDWMAQQLEENRPWDAIVRDLLLATGEVRSEGATGLVFAHTGNPEELAGEVSRIFLGIQLSCANCHDHPTDRWKREQFHQLAAYFPRVTVRPETPGDVRSFAVRSLAGRELAGRASGANPEQLFRGLDRNRDGRLSAAEARGPLASRFEATLRQYDADQDGQLSFSEFQAARAQAEGQPGRGAVEHYMADLQNPASPGTVMQPQFFLTNSAAALPRGADDIVRRDALARAITSPENPWFAKALVNRLWTQLLGVGFYEPLDDMGPDRTPVAEDVLELLATRLIEEQFDLRWLLRTIVATQAYQRSLATAADPPGLVSVPFAAAVPIRLRSDQIYDSLALLFPGGLSDNGALGRRMDAQAGGPLARNTGRAQFQALFQYDASTPQADVLGTIPQALMLMNSPRLEGDLRATGRSLLSRLLRQNSTDEAAVEELYLRVLSRSPSPVEQQLHRELLQEAVSREAAYEDMLWCLLNSAEFITRR